MFTLIFDTETYTILPGLLAPPLVCVAVRTEHGSPFLHDVDHGATAVEYSLDLGHKLVGHNIAYDFAVLCAHRPSLLPKVFAAYKEGRVRCTKIRQQLLDIACGMNRVHGKLFVKRKGQWAPPDYSLAGNDHGGKGLINLYAGRDRSVEKGPDAWRMRYHELAGTPISEWPEAAVAYPKADVDDTWAVYQAQGPDLLVNEREQVYAAWALHLVSCWGLRSDPQKVGALEADAIAKFTEVQSRLYAEGFYRLDPLAPSEIAAGAKADGIMPPTYTKTGKLSAVSGRPAKFVKNTDVIRQRVEEAFRGQGLEAPRTDPSTRAPKGQVKTDADTLEQTGDPLLQELGESGPIGTILRTFVPTLKRGTKTPINTRFNTLLETGRISSADPNLNNIPREGGVRECFVPRPGHVFCSVDYDCAELRALGQVCLWLFGKSALAEFFQKDPRGDPHLELAASILGITSDEAKRRKKAGDPEIKHIRQGCKALNFGLPGGLGIDTFIYTARKNYGVVFSRSEATERKAQWFAKWPEMEGYLGYVSRRVGYAGTSLMQLRPDGLPHRARGEVGYCDGANGYFQGLIADAFKEALCRVSEEGYVDCGTALYGSRPVVALYDEIIAEVPEDIAHEAAHRLADVMVEGAQAWIPDVPMTASPALMECWYKGAEGVYADGCLVPWRPLAA